MRASPKWPDPGRETTPDSTPVSPLSPLHWWWPGFIASHRIGTALIYDGIDWSADQIELAWCRYNASVVIQAMHIHAYGMCVRKTVQPSCQTPSVGEMFDRALTLGFNYFFNAISHRSPSCWSDSFTYIASIYLLLITNAINKDNFKNLSFQYFSQIIR